MADPEEVGLSKETCDLLERFRNTCPLCKWILEDFSENQKLTGYPKDFGGSTIFPVGAKIAHIELLKKDIENGGTGRH